MKDDIKKGHLKVRVAVNNKKFLVKTKEYEDTITAQPKPPKNKKKKGKKRQNRRKSGRNNYGKGKRKA